MKLLNSFSIEGFSPSGRLLHVNTVGVRLGLGTTNWDILVAGNRDYNNYLSELLVHKRSWTDPIICGGKSVWGFGVRGCVALCASQSGHTTAVGGCVGSEHWSVGVGFGWVAADDKCRVYTNL